MHRCKKGEEKRLLSGTWEADRIVLRPVQHADDSFIFTLFTGSRPDLEWIAGIDQDRKQELLLQQFRCEHEQLRRDYPNAEYSIILLEGNPVGRLYVHRGEKEYRILVITLAPEYRGRGIGRNLIKSILREAYEAGKPVRIQVAWYNQSARALYERLGFRIIENSGVYYVMQWSEEKKGST